MLVEQFETKLKKNCILVRTAWSILAETEEPKVLSQFVWNRNLSRTDLSRFLEPNENRNRKVITEGTRNW